ncbi:unnamed protein product [Rotaria sordida]|uniref:Uncharacterized protein n=1 Tax=Rotaria sordida TaxID=392033 RepID=A0A813THJ7_9BILA|nr:unnamed protein product [Rotaria sordida]
MDDKYTSARFNDVQGLQQGSELPYDYNNEEYDDLINGKHTSTRIPLIVGHEHQEDENHEPNFHSDQSS